MLTDQGGRLLDVADQLTEHLRATLQLCGLLQAGGDLKVRTCRLPAISDQLQERLQYTALQPEQDLKRF